MKLYHRIMILFVSAFLFGAGEYFYFHYQLPRPPGAWYHLTVSPIILASCYLIVKGIDKNKALTILLVLLVLPLWFIMEDVAYYLTDCLSFQKWGFPASTLPPTNQWRETTFGAVHPILGIIGRETEKVGWCNILTGYWYGSLITLLGFGIYIIQKKLRKN